MFVTKLLETMGALEGDDTPSLAPAHASLSDQLKAAQRDLSNKQESKTRTDFSRTLERIARIRAELDDFEKMKEELQTLYSQRNKLAKELGEPVEEPPSASASPPAAPPAALTSKAESGMLQSKLQDQEEIHRAAIVELESKHSAAIAEMEAKYKAQIDVLKAAAAAATAVAAATPAPALAPVPAPAPAVVDDDDDDDDWGKELDD